MAELKENQLVFVDEKGEEILCDIIFTYESEEFKKNYVFFSQVGSADEDGRVEVGCASYIEKDGGIGELFQIEDDKEWDMLAEVFDQFAKDSECECGCGCGCGCEDCDCDEDCDCNNGEDCCCHDGHCECHHHEE